MFLVLIVFMLATNVLVWSFTKNAEYNQAVMDINQEEADRRNENVVASHGSYSVDGDKVTVRGELRNIGSMVAQIVNLWVIDTTIQKHGFNHTITASDLNLSPGNDRTVSVAVTILGADQSHIFNAWFVTSRGNIVPLETETRQEVPEYVVPHPWIDIGFIRFRFEYNSLNFTSETYQNPLPGWVVPGAPRRENLMFHVKIVNTGEVALKLLKYSVFYLLEYRSGQGGAAQQAYPFYIVSPNSTYPGSKPSQDAMYPYDEDGSPYVLQPNPEGKPWLGGPPVIIKFGSKETGGDTPICLDANCEYLAFIGIYYSYIDNGHERQLGQTIPFVAVRSANPYPPPDVH